MNTQLPQNIFHCAYSHSTVTKHFNAKVMAKLVKRSFTSRFSD